MDEPIRFKSGDTQPDLRYIIYIEDVLIVFDFFLNEMIIDIQQFNCLDLKQCILS